MTAELVFDCLGGEPERYAASPTLVFRLRIVEATGLHLQSITLRCQIRILPQQRTYSDTEAVQLRDLFGGRSRWADTMQPVQLATVTSHVPGFTGSTETDVHVPVSYDLDVAAGRYFDALTDGVIPLTMLFSGTVLWRDEATGAISATQVPWHKDASYRLPVSVWRAMIDLYFPDSGWIRLNRATIAALSRVKTNHTVSGWDEIVGLLLKKAGEHEA
jgi:hypothetical protein